MRAGLQLGLAGVQQFAGRVDAALRAAGGRSHACLAEWGCKAPSGLTVPADVRRSERRRWPAAAAGPSNPPFSPLDVAQQPYESGSQAEQWRFLDFAGPRPPHLMLSKTAAARRGGFRNAW